MTAQDVADADEDNAVREMQREVIRRADGQIAVLQLSVSRLRSSLSDATLTVAALREELASASAWYRSGWLWYVLGIGSAVAGFLLVTFAVN